MVLRSLPTAQQPVSFRLRCPILLVRNSDPKTGTSVPGLFHHCNHQNLTLEMRVGVPTVQFAHTMRVGLLLSWLMLLGVHVVAESLLLMSMMMVMFTLVMKLVKMFTTSQDDVQGALWTMVTIFIRMCTSIIMVML